MYIEVKQKPNGKYEVNPNVQIQATLADMPPMGAEISSYDTVYAFLGLPEPTQQLDESFNDTLWKQAEGSYDGNNKTYFARSYYEMINLSYDYYIRSGDKIYQSGGSDEFTSVNTFDIVESDIVVKLNGTIISQGRISFNENDELTIEPVAGKVCMYEDAGSTGFSEFTESETIPLSNYEYCIITTSKDTTNNTLSFAKYILTSN